MFKGKHNCDMHGHQLEPRYDATLQPITPEVLEVFEMMMLCTQDPAIDTLKDTRYVCDVCVKCGFQVPRPGESEKDTTKEEFQCIDGPSNGD